MPSIKINWKYRKVASAFAQIWSIHTLNSPFSNPLASLKVLADRQTKDFHKEVEPRNSAVYDSDLIMLNQHSDLSERFLNI